LTGKDMSYSVTRYPLLLGLLCTASYLSLSKSSLYDSSDISGLSIWGLIISGLMMGIGTSYATVGIESAVYNHLPHFNKGAII
jgi:predicted histidine transporter YuiF (NhaC family)